VDGRFLLIRGLSAISRAKTRELEGCQAAGVRQDTTSPFRSKSSKEPASLACLMINPGRLENSAQ